MKPIALVIEDDPEIRAALMDRLESLGHDHHPAGCQHEARERLARCGYTYVLLDLELPVRYGRTPLIQTGKNLLQEIRSSERHAETPVIVVTAHGHDRPDLAVEVMKAGATDFVKKPFGALEDAIADALGGNGTRKAALPTNAPPAAREPRKLEGGRIVFYEESIELEGVIICTPESGTMWRMLNILRERRPDGRPRSFPGKRLADMLELDRGQSAICDALSHFRRRVIERMAEIGIEADDDSVVITGRGGYEIHRDLKVEDLSGQPRPKTEDEEPVPTTEDRQAWILAQIKARKKVKRKDVEDEFDVSVATAKRDIMALGEKIEFIGPKQTGHYRLRRSR